MDARGRPLAHAVRWAALPIALSLAAPAQAAPRPVDLPAGPLGRSLALLARQADADIGTIDAGLAAEPAPAVRGMLSARAALDRLLARSDSMAIRMPRGGWRIVRRPRDPGLPFRPFVTATSRDPIVVIGSKRATPFALYPGTAHILSPADLTPAGALPGSITLDQRIASVASTHFGPGRDKLFVRGMADSGFTGPSQSTTGQYLDDTRLTYNAPDPDLRLYDIAAIEVLEGPQGTLYGAGSLGGVVRVATVRPILDRFSASIAGGVATTAHGDPGGDLAGVLNLPLAHGDAALRLVGYGVRDGGYIDNPLLGRRDVNGVTTAGGRAALRIRAGDWTIDLGGAGQAIRGDDAQWADGDASPLTRRTAERLPYRNDYALGDLTMTRDWGGLHLVSANGITRQHLVQTFDATEYALPAMVRQRDRIAMLSSETRLSRRGSDGTGWVIGLSLLDNRSRLGRIGIDANGGTTPREALDNHVREITLFGEAGIAIGAGIVATPGLRLTAARVQGDAAAYIEASTIPIFGGPVSARGRHTEGHALPSLALSGQPVDGLLLFARYEQGFRPGGFGISSTRARSYGGDHVGTIEAGLRFRPRDGTLDLSLTLAHTHWRDILAEVVTQGGDPITENIGDGHIDAIEAEAGWRPMEGLRLDAGLFLNRSRLTDPAFDSVLVRGSALPNVARFGAQAGLDHRLALSDGLVLTTSVHARWHGGSHIGAGPVLDAAQGRYLDDDVTMRIGGTARGVSVEITNLQDSHANRFAFGTPYRLYDPQATPPRPRTIRIRFDASL